MQWRLGLDIGTNSIGWCALGVTGNHDEKNYQLLDMGVRIFSDSREPKTGTPLNEERRKARQMRRQRERRIRRKNAMKGFCVLHGLLPQDKAAQQEIASYNPYQLRSEALNRKLEPFELGRILMQLANRRGFKSNRKEQLQNSEVEGMKAGIEKLTKALGDKTLGQWLYDQQQAGNPIRFRPRQVGSRIEYPLYPSREMYETEFSKITSIQKKFYPDINWDRIHWLIFFQRPLKRPERGRCQFYSDEVRGYKALPSAHRFRILQEINNLGYYDACNKFIEVPANIKTQLFDLLEKQKQVSFKKVRSLFGDSGVGVFNLENEKRESLKGNETSVEMRKETYFGPLWDRLSWEEQDHIIETLITAEESEITQLLGNYSVPPENIQNILGYNFPTGTTMLSARFMRECGNIMLEQHIPYHEATEKLGFHHSREEQPELLHRLPYYGTVLTSLVQNAHGETPGYLKFPNEQAKLEYKYGKIANPTVHVALNQLRKLINALIRRFGRPHEIIVEVGRELKLSKKAKDEIRAEQARNQQNNERARNQLRELGLLAPSNEDIKKYLLWEELSHGNAGLSRCCPYCGKAISAQQLLGNDIEIEHILPYSKTLLNTRDNLTVAHRHCNQVKGERSPYDAFGSNPPGYNWEDIVQRVQHLPPRKRRKFTPTALNEFLDENTFLQKQLTDNAYISRSAKHYLSVICHKDHIWVSTGRLTALLRGSWGLNTLLNSTHDTWHKNRSDHRHHALDALVIGLCDRSLINKMARINSTTGYHRIAIPEFPLKRDEIANKLKTMLVSMKLNHGKEGQIFKETAMGKITHIKKIKPNELQEKDIPAIIPPGIRQKVKEINDTLGWKNGSKKLASQFTHFYIPEEIWVSTCPITALSESDIENKRIVDKQ
ncbi:MAG: type II CRISPR RNA-guided endonuclease Cas9, partial [Termitinemataceae bacterium]